MHPALALRLTALLCLAVPTLAETVKDREGALRQDRAARENDPRWIYNDVSKGFAEAKRTGKPMLVVLRCVPCLACAGIDAQVLLENSDITPLLDQFVCVRLINANALDLSRFQFDYDLSFTALTFHGDGTLYGRYGSWSHQKDSQNTATAGFRLALERSLGLHRGYPANRAQLAGKQGAPSPYATPINIPGLEGRFTLDLNWNGKVVPSCVHCHQVADGLRLTLREQKQPLTDELIYPMPAPETVGFTLAKDQVARVESVQPGTPAAHAGLQVGDDLVELGGQALVSVADVSWVLHRQGSVPSLPAVVRRAGQEQRLTLTLPTGWRGQSDISGRVGTWGMRAMALGGLQLGELTDGERGARGLQADRMALVVKHAGEYGKHAAAKKAGFQKGDVLVELEGQTGRISESALIGRILKQHPPGTQLPAQVLRGQERLALQLPVQ
jgi:serine protease Do